MNENFSESEINKQAELEQRQVKFKEILTRETESGDLPEEIFILSGGITEANPGANGEKRYESTAYSDEDVHGLAGGGRVAVIAAAEIGKVLPEMKLITTSTVEKDAPSHAAVMKAELVKRGINPDQVILEEESASIFTELVEMVKLAVKNNWSRIGIIANDFRLPRTRAMFTNMELIINYDDPEFMAAITEFRKRNIDIAFIPAEEVLENVSGHWRKLFSDFRESEGYVKRIAAEAKGLKDLEEGRYKVYKKIN